jgi:hypothetical protein
MKCPICERRLRKVEMIYPDNLKKTQWYCPSCILMVWISDKPIPPIGSIHADFCEDFRKYQEDPKPKPRLEEP